MAVASTPPAAEARPAAAASRPVALVRGRLSNAFSDIQALTTMPIFSKDWRDPGDKWVKTDGGWEKEKVLCCSPLTEMVVRQV